MSSEAEKALKTCNSLKQLCSVGERFRDDISASLQQPTELLTDIMHRLELKGKKFEVEAACSKGECIYELCELQWNLQKVWTCYF